MTRSSDVVIAAVLDGLHLRAGDVDVTLERRDDDVFVAPHPDWDRFLVIFGRAGGAGAEPRPVVEVCHGPDRYVSERFAGSPPGEPRVDWVSCVGHYRSWSGWMSDLRVYERQGRLWLGAPWVENVRGELELVPLDDGSFRAGAEEWRPDRVRFDAVVGGRATRVWFDQAPLYRAFTV